jgi:predicted lipoprotein with Yx(FWY)xxD motif
MASGHPGREAASIRSVCPIPFRRAAACVAGSLLLLLGGCATAGTVDEQATSVKTAPSVPATPGERLALAKAASPSKARPRNESVTRTAGRSATKRTRAASRPTVVARSSRFGRILFDGRGYVLYAFTRDRSGQSACKAACAAAWPPYLVRGTLRVGRGLDRSLLGTTRRPDGRRQVTYAGHPLYYYVGDRRRGQILCQNVDEFGGLWLVVRPSGALVR